MTSSESSEQLLAEWPAIHQAQKASAAQLTRLREAVRASLHDPIDSGDVSLVVFGSLARGEWTQGSDLDWTLLIDGQADHRHAQAAHRVAQLAKQLGFTAPTEGGVFGRLTFSHSLIHHIGGHEDTNRNTTQRLLLLLESQAVHRDEAHGRVLRGILDRYLENEPGRPQAMVPRFLLNDYARYWRTVCVDYADKVRDRAGQAWALRHAKLRFSRKLLYMKGLLTCFACDPEFLGKEWQELRLDNRLDHLYTMAKRPALDVLAEVLARFGTKRLNGRILGAYDAFLRCMNDPRNRQTLAGLRAADAEECAIFRDLREQGRQFHEGLTHLCFDMNKRNQRLRQLILDYGVF
jgi:predicted nucleotidyltransferase